jgi:hypothetical protein
VTCLAFEARIAAREGVEILHAPGSEPAASLLRLRLGGTSDLKGVLRSVARQPGQLPLLLRADARALRAALLQGRLRLGTGLGFPAARAMQLEAGE